MKRMWGIGWCVFAVGCAQVTPTVKSSFMPDQATHRMDENKIVTKRTVFGTTESVRIDQVQVTGYQINSLTDQCLPAGPMMVGNRDTSFSVAQRNKPFAHGSFKERLVHTTLIGNGPGDPPYDNVSFSAGWKSLKHEYALRLSGTDPNDLHGSLLIDGDVITVKSLKSPDDPLPQGYSFSERGTLIAQAATTSSMEALWLDPAHPHADVIRTATAILQGRTVPDFAVWATDDLSAD